MKKKFSAISAAWMAGMLLCAWSAKAQSSGPTATPASLSFNYQVNSTTYPAAAKVTASLPASLSSYTLTVMTASVPSGWLTVTPDSGRSPLALSVLVNPTSLAPGSYIGTITINTIPATSNPAVVTVTLSISNPPSTLQVTSPSSNYTVPTSGNSPTLTFTYTTGAFATIPSSSELDVASTGDTIPFNVTAANASAKGSGGTTTPVWLRVSQSNQLPNLTTSGVALSGSYVPISVTLDLTTLASLDPGSYGGLITIAANTAANGSATVNVNLVVSAGAPNVTSIFPDHIIAGPAIDPIITINGDNFFSTSVVAIQLGGNPAITLPSTLLSRKVLRATIKAAYLAINQGDTYDIVWILSVTNPAPPNNPSQLPAIAALTITDPTKPGITSVVNAASYLSTGVFTGTGTNPVPTGATAVSPREIISIFGQNLGPAAITQVAATGSPAAFPASSGNVMVAFQFGNPVTTVYAPLIMVSSNQINCIVPVEVSAVLGSANPTVAVTVVNGAATTSSVNLTVVPEDPGVFTFGGLGQGQGAVLNFDSTSGSYVINASKSAAPRGSTISIYATGMGDLDPSAGVPNGGVATTAVRVADNTCRVDIDGQPAVVSYAGTSPGAVAGLVQINAVVPPTVRTGAAIPLTVSIGSATSSRRSQPGVTFAVK